jgi:L-ribulokinase
MVRSFLIGLDFGTESARGVLIDVATGSQMGHHVHPYRHGVVTGEFRSMALPPNFVLQVPSDFIEAAEVILTVLGRDQDIAGIGVDFTASSPMPVLADSQPLAMVYPDNPHAYVKLWKHSAQKYARDLSARGGQYLDAFGGKVSGEWLLAKAAQIEQEAPDIWVATDRFIEAGDWLVWQLTGREARSLDFAAYKAQYSPERGYPVDSVLGLADRLSDPYPVGTAAGSLTAEWRQRTGVRGAAAVAVAAIDSHAVLPAIAAVTPGSFVGALGTSAAFLILDDHHRPLPKGFEGTAYGAAIPDLWCCEAGQSAFGDTLAWYVRTFPRSDDMTENFKIYNKAAEDLAPGKGGLIALDWFGGNRAPLADSMLSGLLVGLNLQTTSSGIYRALIESLCFGTRLILDLALDAGVDIKRIVLTSGLTRNNPFLVQTMADVFGRVVEVPEIENPTAVGAASHAAVAGGVAANFEAAASRFGSRGAKLYRPNAAATRRYDTLYIQYQRLAADGEVQAVMHTLNDINSRRLEA